MQGAIRPVAVGEVVVRSQQYRGAVSLGHLRKNRQQGQPLRDVKAGERLVQEEHPRPGGDHCGEGHPVLFAEREG